MQDHLLQKRLKVVVFILSVKFVYQILEQENVK